MYENNLRRTRLSAFIEQWPNAQVDNQGILFIYPCMEVNIHLFSAGLR
nr:MAG TPA: hypothetical protein [Caudoviricetes sp.]